MDKVLAEIASEKYSFLKQNPDLQNIAFLTLSGSHGYGTNNENSDIDLRGVLIEDKKYLLGLNTFEQFEDLPSDTVIFGLKKFVSLCANANPNTLELLGTDPECLVIINKAGEKLRENAHLFLSKRIINTFGDYAAAQLRRLEKALCHDVYDANKQEEYLASTLSGQIRHFNEAYTPFEEGALRIYTEEVNGSSQLLFDIDLKGYPVRDFIGIYSEMNSTVRAYNKLNHRNKKKDEQHLYKHAMHLIRLLITGTDILRGKGIITRRKEEHQLLMDLRNGAYDFAEIFRITEEFREKFENAAAKSRLPDRPDLPGIESLMTEIYEQYLARK